MGELYYEEYGHGGGYDPYTGAPSRSMYAGYARKSQAAQRREDAAHQQFLVLVAKETTKTAVRKADASGAPATFPLLTPATHLTGPSPVVILQQEDFCRY